MSTWDKMTGQRGRVGSWKAPKVRAREEELDYTRKGSQPRRRRARINEHMSDDEILAEYNKMMRRGGL